MFSYGIPLNYIFKQYKPWLKIYGLDEPDGTKIYQLTGAKYKPIGPCSKNTINYFCVMTDEISGLEYIYKNSGKSVYLNSIMSREHFTYENFNSKEFKEIQINSWTKIRMWDFPKYEKGNICQVCGRVFQPSNGGETLTCGYDDIILTDKDGVSQEVKKIQSISIEQ